MPLTTGPWTAEDYRILHEGRDVNTTARLLNRSPDEVRRKVDVTFEDWYRRRRCPGSPESYQSIWTVSWKMYKDHGYARLLTEGEMMEIIFDQAQRCFAKFNPDKYRKAISVQRKFTGYFTTCLRRRLWKRRAKDARSRRRRIAFADAIPPWTATRRPWARMLLRAALPRLKERTRRVVELHYLQGLTMDEVAERIGVAKQTLYNTTSKHRLASDIRDAIRSHLLSLPTARLAAAVWFLDDEGFNVGAISSLLCLPVKDVRRLLQFPVPDDLVCKTREAAMALLETEDDVQRSIAA